jgi:hypothetical protein
LSNITVEAQYPNASFGDDIAFNTDTGMVYHLVNNNTGAAGVVYQFNGIFLSLFVSFVIFSISLPLTHSPPSWSKIILGQLAWFVSLMEYFNLFVSLSLSLSNYFYLFLSISLTLAPSLLLPSDWHGV